MGSGRRSSKFCIHLDHGNFHRNPFSKHLVPGCWEYSMFATTVRLKQELSTNLVKQCKRFMEVAHPKILWANQKELEEQVQK